MKVENFNEPDKTNDVLTTQETKERVRKYRIKKEYSVYREMFSWFLSVAIALAAAILLKNYVIINANVPTGSMENTIMSGDRLLGNRLAYLWSEPERGDVVIFYYPDNENELYVKRIIGLPGETVVIEDGKIYINGSKEPLEEPYLKEKWTTRTGPYRYEIPENCYLMLGDNRNDSLDARYWNNTYVKKEKILGKALITYWPFENIGILD